MKILVNDPIHVEGLKLLREKGFEVKIGEYEPKQLISAIKDYDVLIVRSKTKVTKEVIDAAKKLKIIARAGVGLDNIDVEYAKSKGIEIVNTPAAPTESVAELTIALILDMLRSVTRGNLELKKGNWVKKELMGFEFSGKTLGVIGYGRIGRSVALKAKAFGAKVLVFDVFEKAFQQAFEDGFKVYTPSKNELKEMLKKCDIITLHIPLIPSTKNFIGEEELDAMKNGVFIVNTSRGGIINEAALLKKLNEGKVKAAALDVFEEEPPRSGASLELSKHGNCICTPHIGASTYEAQRKAAVMVAEKIIQISENKKF